MSRIEQLFAAREHAELAEILSGCADGDPNVHRIAELLDFAARPDAPVPADLAITEEDQLFLGNIAEVKRLLFPGTSPWRSRSYYRVGREYDFLAADHGRRPEQWSLLQLLNYLTMQRLRPTRRSAVVTSMRDDGIVLSEWIAHYRALGFEGIFIYSNDNEDGSTELLRHLADLGEITFLENFTSVNHEIKTSEHALQFLIELRDFEWVLFVDSDEFLVPAAAFDSSVDNILDAVGERFPDQPPAAIIYNWKVFVSGAGYARQPGLLLERYRYSYAEPHVKTFARLSAVYSMRLNHVPDVKPTGFCVDSALRPINHPGPICQKPPEYDGGQINHYWTRSFEEYSLKKARGDRTPPDAALFRRSFRHFFEWNAPERSGMSSEGLIGFEPPPDELVRKVKAQRARLEMLPGVPARLAEIERNFPRLLARFDDQGGLRAIYEEARKGYS